MKTLGLPIILCCTLLTACQKNDMEPLAMNDSIRDDIQQLSSQRIFFGHQSVGNNILQGLEDLNRETQGNTVSILEYTASTDLPEQGFLVHTGIGENEKPVSKCKDFKSIINHELANKIDMALLKFCYIDINEDSDVEALFAQYRDILDTLKSDHPDITFIHVTAPLRHSESGPGIWIRELLGKPNRSKLANMKRHQFNELVRAHYANDALFDLAASESTFPDGSRNTFTYGDDTEYPNLIREYTYDGGHLNETGRKKVAADFVSRLAAIARSASSPSG